MEHTVSAGVVAEPVRIMGVSQNGYEEVLAGRDIFFTLGLAPNILLTCAG